MRNEAARLPALVRALAAQQDLRGRPLHAASWEVILLLNNCTDDTPAVAARLQELYPSLRLHVMERDFASHEAHVGKARQLLFATAEARFLEHGLSRGLILTTDADSQPAPDWVAQNAAEIAHGVDAVGGRITIDRAELATLPRAVVRYLLLDIGYRRALEELRALYDPVPPDPFPRHHQHFGASLAVTAAAHRRAGGMPLRRHNEDVALIRALTETGSRVRHSYRVRVSTSARMVGRAQSGLADALTWWHSHAEAAMPVLVENAAAAEARLAKLGLYRLAHPGLHPPAELTQTPEPPTAAEAAELAQTLRDLRAAAARLRGMTFSARIEQAQRRFAGPVQPAHTSLSA